MGKLKLNKLYVSIITSLLLIFTVFSGISYAADDLISERYVYDEETAKLMSDAYGYGLIYDEGTFGEINKDDMKNVYKALRTEFRNNYSEDDEYKKVLIEQIKTIDKDYTVPNDLNTLEKDWLDKKVEYASLNMECTIYDYFY